MFVPEEAFARIAAILRTADAASAITWCGRLNILQSALPDEARTDTLRRVLFADAPEMARDALGGDRHNPDAWVYGLNRMPLLELVRWAAVLESGAGQLEEPAERQALVEAARMAGQLAVYRAFATHGGGFPEDPSDRESIELGLTLTRVLRQFPATLKDPVYLLARAKLMAPAYFDDPWRALSKMPPGCVRRTTPRVRCS